MSYLDFKKQCCDMMINSMKKSIMTQRCVTYLNIFLALLNGYNTWSSPNNIFSAVVTGAIIANVMWCWGQLVLLKGDLKLEKEHLARIVEMEDSQDYKNSLKELETHKQYYEDIIKWKGFPNVAAHENKTPESVSPKVETP
jgi:hypothetical protein